MFLILLNMIIAVRNNAPHDRNHGKPVYPDNKHLFPGFLHPPRSGKGRTGSAPVYPIRYIPLISYCHYYKYHYLTNDAITFVNSEISPPRWPFPTLSYILSTLHRNNRPVIASRRKHGVQDEPSHSPVPVHIGVNIHEKKCPKTALTAGCGSFFKRSKRTGIASLTAFGFNGICCDPRI